MQTGTKKYKQLFISNVTTADIPAKNRSKFIKEYYAKNLQGKVVRNIHLGIDIHFNSIGKSELAHGRALHAKKVAIIKCLYELVQNAEYNNFGKPKTTDPDTVLGYLNFKAKVYIDHKAEYVRISVLVKKNLKAYYHHEVNIKK